MYITFYTYHMFDGLATDIGVAIDHVVYSAEKNLQSHLSKYMAGKTFQEGVSFLVVVFNRSSFVEDRLQAKAFDVTMLADNDGATKKRARCPTFTLDVSFVSNSPEKIELVEEGIWVECCSRHGRTAEPVMNEGEDDEITLQYAQEWGNLSEPSLINLEHGSLFTVSAQCSITGPVFSPKSTTVKKIHEIYFTVYTKDLEEVLSEYVIDSS